MSLVARSRVHSFYPAELACTRVPLTDVSRALQMIKLIGKLEEIKNGLDLEYPGILVSRVTSRHPPSHFPGFIISHDPLSPLFHNPYWFVISLDPLFPLFHYIT